MGVLGSLAWQPEEVLAVVFLVGDDVHVVWDGRTASISEYSVYKMGNAHV